MADGWFLCYLVVMTETEKYVMATVCYYDVLDFPLKEEEIFDFLIIGDGSPISKVFEPNRDDVLKTAKKLFEDKKLGFLDGYYFLPEREYLAPLREKKSAIKKIKMRKARYAVWWLNFTPFLKAIFASGSLGLGNTDEVSDLDILTIAKSGRIWTSRFCITVLLYLIGMKRRPKDIMSPDKICPNHYITDKSLFINLKSIYNAQTYINLKPLIINDESLATRFKDENSWVNTYVNKWPAGNHSYILNRNLGQKLISRMLEFILGGRFGDFIEKKLGGYQVSIILKNPLTYIKGSKVAYSNDHLEFHPDSPEKQILSRYSNRLKAMGVAMF